MRNQAYIEKYLSEIKTIAKNISRKDIDEVIENLFKAWKEGKQVFIMGNGGSASTATHFVCDLSKTTIVGDKKRFKAIGLIDNIPLTSAWINDNGFENLFSEQLINFIQEGDIVIGISVHGGSGSGKAGFWSQNLLKAMKLAKDSKAKTVGFSGFEGGAMKEIADVCIVIPFNSTPQVESFHLALAHLICNCLKEKIENYEEK